ncbi:MAG: hypothetical protein ACHQK8_06585 [Bacteroidia bacterium]
MKRIVTLLLIFFYLVPSIGFSMDLHFCGDKVTGISVSLLHTDKCKCGKKAAAKCCKEVQVTVKISDSQKITTQNNSEKKSNPVKIYRGFVSSNLSAQFYPVNQNISGTGVPFRLPCKSKLPVYLSIQSLLI